MGDLIEMTTWPNTRNIFYKITSSGVNFEVKASSGAAIGLAKRTTGFACDIWVVIGQSHNQSTWIKRKEGSGKIIRTPDILNDTEYRRFWLTWKDGCIQLGLGQDKNPIISHANNLDISYVTFSSREDNVIGGWNAVNWRIELPPILEKPDLKSVTGGELQWVHADNQLPDGAFIGGYEKETLYIIRASHRGSLTPGKFVPSQGTGFISWGGEAHDKNEFEVLCGFDCTWVPTFEDRIPVGAVEGGYSEGREKEKLYVGRVLYNGHLIPGKVQPSHKVCYIPHDGREIGQKKFEVLVSPDANARCANKLLLDRLEVDSPPESENEDEEINEDEIFDEIHNHGDEAYVVAF